MLDNRFVKGIGGTAIAALFTLSTLAPSFADEVTLKKGTDVVLAFDQSLNSKTAKVGDRVTFHVDQPVEVDGKTVIKEGTKVTGTVRKVSKKAAFGVNAKIQLNMDPIQTVEGKSVALGFKTATKGMSRPGGAAGASVGGAAVLGPIGLVAGYFVTGRTFDVKPGDKLTVNTDEDATINVP